MTRWQMRQVFSSAVLDAITQQVKQCESTHGGEIRVAIEAELSTRALIQNQTTRARAIEVFATLHVWDTLSRNGVLIYLCLADRAIEIVADRGFDGKITAMEWSTICKTMESHCAQGHYQRAVCSAIEAVSEIMRKYFPIRDENELEDRPVLV